MRNAHIRTGTTRRQASCTCIVLVYITPSLPLWVPTVSTFTSCHCKWHRMNMPTSLNSDLDPPCHMPKRFATQNNKFRPNQYQLKLISLVEDGRKCWRNKGYTFCCCILVLLYVIFIVYTVTVKLIHSYASDCENSTCLVKSVQTSWCFFLLFNEHNRTLSGKKMVTGVQVITVSQYRV